MTEEATEQVKKKLAMYLASEDYPNRPEKEIEVLANTTPYPERANDIVSIPEILIKNPDQSFPEHPPISDGAMQEYGDLAVRTRLAGYDQAQQDMLKEHWVKVLPKDKK